MTLPHGVIFILVLLISVIILDKFDPFKPDKWGE